MKGQRWAAALLLLLIFACSRHVALVEAKDDDSGQFKACKKYFEDIKPNLDNCQRALARLPFKTGVTCPDACKGVFKDMRYECSIYVDKMLPDKYKGQKASEMHTESHPFDICEMLFCSSPSCTIALDVLRTTELFNLPNMQETSSSSEVNVGAIVAGVVAGNAVIVAVVGGFVLARRHRQQSRLHAAQLKALAAFQGAASQPGGGGMPHGAGPDGALNAAELGASSKQAMAKLWAQAAARGTVAPQWGVAEPYSPGSASTQAASHMQADEFEMLRMGERMSPLHKVSGSVHSDPVLSWVNSQLQQEGSQVDAAPATPAAVKGAMHREDSAAAPPEDNLGVRGDDTAAEESSESQRGSSEVQASAGSRTSTLRPLMSGMTSQRRSSGWMALDTNRSSGLVDLKPWQLSYSDLKIQRPLGEGSYGKVYLALWNETLVAVKLLISADEGPAKSSIGSGSRSLPMPVSEELQKEAGLMASLRHPNVVLFLGVCSTPPAVVTEYCSRGSLLDVLRSAQASEQLTQQLTWVRRLSMALDAAKGMLCLHAHNPQIIHRDLKSPNLLVDSAWRVKVCDFNLSKLMEDSIQSSSAGGLLNPRWLAPEVLMGEKATAASDVFSFGTVLWELLTWQLPWEGANLYQLVFMVSRGERLSIPPHDQLAGPEQLSEYEAYVSLIRRCWAQQPAERPSFADVISELRSMMTRVVAANASPPANLP